MALLPGRPAARGRPCPHCRGQGKVPVRDGERVVLVVCPVCHGERFRGPPVWTK